MGGASSEDRFCLRVELGCGPCNTPPKPPSKPHRHERRDKDDKERPHMRSRSKGPTSSRPQSPNIAIRQVTVVPMHTPVERHRSRHRSGSAARARSPTIQVVYSRVEEMTASNPRRSTSVRRRNTAPAHPEEATAPQHRRSSSRGRRELPGQFHGWSPERKKDYSYYAEPIAAPPPPSWPVPEQDYHPTPMLNRAPATPPPPSPHRRRTPDIHSSRTESPHTDGAADGGSGGSRRDPRSFASRAAAAERAASGRGESHRRDHDRPATGESHRRDYDRPATRESHRRDHDRPTTGESHRRDYDRPATGESHRRDYDRPATRESHRRDHDRPTTGESHRRDPDRPATRESHRRDHDYPATGESHRRDHERPTTGDGGRRDRHHRHEHTHDRYPAERPVNSGAHVETFYTSTDGYPSGEQYASYTFPPPQSYENTYYQAYQGKTHPFTAGPAYEAAPPPQSYENNYYQAYQGKTHPFTAGPAYEAAPPPPHPYAEGYSSGGSNNHSHRPSAAHGGYYSRPSSRSYRSGYESPPGPTSGSYPGSNGGAYPDPSGAHEPETLPKDLGPYWAELGLQPGADDAAIRSAYKKLALKCHPDRLAGMDEGEKKILEQKFVKVKEAHDILLEK